MRPSTINDDPVLVLREANPPKPPPDHTCPVYHGSWGAVKEDLGIVIQCSCGKRYKVSRSLYDGRPTWKRRLLPWPPRNKDWP